mmetsp:Transcript_100430/g.322182  ORF Transcript_100430/g.322182 Transcript_100430/m.322182 type:complete len:323 (-) Transcript_100430:965-1933(-)
MPCRHHELVERMQRRHPLRTPAILPEALRLCNGLQADRIPSVSGLQAFRAQLLRKPRHELHARLAAQPRGRTRAVEVVERPPLDAEAPVVSNPILHQLRVALQPVQRLWASCKRHLLSKVLAWQRPDLHHQRHLPDRRIQHLHGHGVAGVDTTVLRQRARPSRGAKGRVHQQPRSHVRSHDDGIEVGSRLCRGDDAEHLVKVSGHVHLAAVLRDFVEEPANVSGALQALHEDEELQRRRPRAAAGAGRRAPQRGGEADGGEALGDDLLPNGHGADAARLNDVVWAPAQDLAIGTIHFRGRIRWRGTRGEGELTEELCGTRRA